jgi:putative SOS response-associated peptidase YedK
MCNRYENRGSATEIRRLASTLGRDLSTTPATDNLASADNIYPDQDAAVVTNRADGGLELIMARWGLPPTVVPLQYIEQYLPIGLWSDSAPEFQAGDSPCRNVFGHA